MLNRKGAEVAKGSGGEMRMAVVGEMRWGRMLRAES